MIPSRYSKSTVHIGMSQREYVLRRSESRGQPVSTKRKRSFLVERCVSRKTHGTYISKQGKGKSNQSREIYVVIYSCRSNIPKTSHLMDGRERFMRGRNSCTSRDSSLFELIIRYCEITGSASTWRDDCFLFARRRLEIKKVTVFSTGSLSLSLKLSL